MYKLSPSSLNLFKECPRCFWLRFNKKIIRPAVIFPSLPSGMDRILKKHFENFAKKGMLPPELCTRKECIGLKLFDDFKKLEEWQNQRKGIKYEENGNILAGAVDYLLVVTEKGTLIVIDYKTRGYAIKEDTATHYQSQMDIYNYLLRKNGYKTEDYALILFYSPKEVLPTGEVLFDTELVKMNISVENAEKLWKDALKCLNGQIPPADENCEWCKWAEKLK